MPKCFLKQIIEPFLSCQHSFVSPQCISGVADSCQLTIGQFRCWWVAHFLKQHPHAVTALSRLIFAQICVKAGLDDFRIGVVNYPVFFIVQNLDLVF